MTNKVSDFKSMQDELQAALDILDEYQQESPEDQAGLVISEADSLLARCEQVVKQHEENSNPKMRVVHHFACSGGTLISKCIAALPSVYLLSEAHANSELALRDYAEFSPTDLVRLAKYAHIPEIKKLSEHIFKNTISTINNHLTGMGSYLVIRYHTHSDYCTSKPVVEENVFESQFCSKYNVLSLLTIRNPIDAYASLKKNGWIHFTPGDFDSYCERYLKHLSHFRDSNIVRYEDFVESPEMVIKVICNVLELPYSDSFIDTFSINKLTGDSGRKSDVISTRERSADDSLMDEASNSSNFNRICKLGWYESI